MKASVLGDFPVMKERDEVSHIESAGILII